MLRIARMAGLGKLHSSDWRAGQNPLWPDIDLAGWIDAGVIPPL